MESFVATAPFFSLLLLSPWKGSDLFLADHASYPSRVVRSILPRLGNRINENSHHGIGRHEMPSLQTARTACFAGKGSVEFLTKSLLRQATKWNAPSHQVVFLVDANNVRGEGDFVLSTSQFIRSLASFACSWKQSGHFLVVCVLDHGSKSHAFVFDNIALVFAGPGCTADDIIARDAGWLFSQEGGRTDVIAATSDKELSGRCYRGKGRQWISARSRFDAQRRRPHALPNLVRVFKSRKLAKILKDDHTDAPLTKELTAVLDDLSQIESDIQSYEESCGNRASQEKFWHRVLLAETLRQLLEPLDELPASGILSRYKSLHNDNNLPNIRTPWPRPALKPILTYMKRSLKPGDAAIDIVSVPGHSVLTDRHLPKTVAEFATTDDKGGFQNTSVELRLSGEEGNKDDDDDHHHHHHFSAVGTNRRNQSKWDQQAKQLEFSKVETQWFGQLKNSSLLLRMQRPRQIQRDALNNLVTEGFTGRDLVAKGFTVAELKAAGFLAKQLADEGFTAADLKAACFSALELRAAGFTSRDLISTGFTPNELKNAGFTPNDLKTGFTMSDLRGLGFTVSELKDVGFAATARELKAAGFTADELKGEHFSTNELIAVGLTIHELKTAGVFASELIARNYTVQQLKAAGFNTKEIRSAAFQLRQRSPAVESITKDLMAAGFTSKDLQAAGFKVKGRGRWKR